MKKCRTEKENKAKKFRETQNEGLLEEQEQKNSTDLPRLFDQVMVQPDVANLDLLSGVIKALSGGRMPGARRRAAVSGLTNLFLHLLPSYTLDIKTHKYNRDSDVTKEEYLLIREWGEFQRALSRMNERGAFLSAVKLLDHTILYNKSDKIVSKVVRGTNSKWGGVRRLCRHAIREMFLSDEVGEKTRKIVEVMSNFEMGVADSGKMFLSPKCVRLLADAGSFFREIQENDEENENENNMHNNNAMNKNRTNNATNKNMNKGNKNVNNKKRKNKKLPSEGDEFDDLKIRERREKTEKAIKKEILRIYLKILRGGKGPEHPEIFSSFSFLKKGIPENLCAGIYLLFSSSADSIFVKNPSTLSPREIFLLTCIFTGFHDVFSDKVAEYSRFFAFVSSLPLRTVLLLRTEERNALFSTIRQILCGVSLDEDFRNTLTSIAVLFLKRSLYVHDRKSRSFSEFLIRKCRRTLSHLIEESEDTVEGGYLLLQCTPSASSPSSPWGLSLLRNCSILPTRRFSFSDVIK